MVTSNPSGGTGSSLARVVVIVTGVSSLVASLISILSIWLQAKNYRKPLHQRYVVRILLMVPIYAAASWASIVSSVASQVLDPIRDIYEAFTIYTFFQLLINFLGGERSIIILTHGRPPVDHTWPLNYCLPKLDISDPQTFLSVKRGILQYAWLKPILALVSIIMKATGTYQEGYLGISSGYLWTGIVYNISVTVSLYSLANFWVCLHSDLVPFRPVPKFLGVKLIIFASYWQGFFLSILQWLGALSNGVPGYTPDNLAAAIQDALICFEMPIFALAHWHAFSWHDYADPSVSAARLPVAYALRDAFGARDLVEDTKMTLRGENYEYRLFDSGDHIIAHAESRSRVRRIQHGMRYERGGKGKYWIPMPGEANSRTPLLSGSSDGDRRGSAADRYNSPSDVEDFGLDEEHERLFAQARELEFGDWNYPVITAHEIPRDQRLPDSSSYQGDHLPELVKKARKHLRSRSSKGSDSRRSSGSSHVSHVSPKKHDDDHDGDGDDDAEERPGSAGSSASRSSHSSQLVDIVVEDREAEAEERIHAERAFGSTPAEPDQQKLFRRATGMSESGDEQDADAPRSSTHLAVPGDGNTHDGNTQGRIWTSGVLDEENVWGR